MSPFCPVCALGISPKGGDKRASPLGGKWPKADRGKPIGSKNDKGEMLLWN